MSEQELLEQMNDRLASIDTTLSALLIILFFFFLYLIFRIVGRFINSFL